ncbi:putative quinol monooxygenase [Marinomonas aquiplantarum]|uniref:Quinol monooxygenase YgiN n=1 Tax=Marinomonas aquiplantarum TaxID=491951 RepID=A0A366CXQ8_9GAMM|nr:antibiotic biosynthesis monooxygenase [Marinomonas aquiplantarum]RBO80251.1 quinol monooxygenase YgiN [Marinomonas aquiplantarum]
MTKITLTGHIMVPHQDLNQVQQALPEHMKLTQEEKGCLAFKVTQNVHNPLRFEVYEEFIDQAAFDLHQARVKTSHWGQVTHNVERFYSVSQGK